MLLSRKLLRRRRRRARQAEKRRRHNAMLKAKLQGSTRRIGQVTKVIRALSSRSLLAAAQRAAAAARGTDGTDGAVPPPPVPTALHVEAAGAEEPLRAAVESPVAHAQQDGDVCVVNGCVPRVLVCLWRGCAFVACACACVCGVCVCLRRVH